MTLFELMVKIGLDTSEYESGIKKSESGLKNFGSKMKSGLATTAKIGAAAVATIGGATMATSAIITKATGKVAEYGDNIDKMSQKMGLSAEKYQEWDAILQHSGSSIDAMKGSMKTLATAAEKGSAEFEKLGLAQEQIANMSQEELFEATIAGLQKVESTTERTYLAGKLLGRGATELGALLNTSAEDTEKMRQRVHELGGVMSDDAVKASAQYQDSLQDLQTAIQGITRKTTSNFLPAMVKVMDGLTSYFGDESGTTTYEGRTAKFAEGINELISEAEKSAPKLFRVVTKIGSALFEAVGKNLPNITKKLVSFGVDSIMGVAQFAPELINASSKILNTIIDGFVNTMPKIGEKLKNELPNILENILPLAEKFTENLRQNAGKMVDAGLSLMVNLAQGIANSLPVLIEHIPQIIINIMGIINDNAPKIIVAGIKIIGYLVMGLIQAIPTIIENIPKIIEAIFAVWSAVNWVSLGTKAVNLIKNGFTYLKNELPNALKSIGEKTINFFRYLNWQATGQTVLQAIVTGVKAVGRLLWMALKSIGQTGIKYIKNINWWSVGKAIVVGIAKGITAVPGIIANALLSITKSGYEKVKAFLGINSPSKLFRKNVGENIGKGMALGIRDSIPAVSGAMDDISSRLTTSALEPLSISSREEYIPDTAEGVLGAMESLQIRDTGNNTDEPRNITVVLELDRTELARTVFNLYNSENQRHGVELAGGYA